MNILPSYERLGVHWMYVNYKDTKRYNSIQIEIKNTKNMKNGCKQSLPLFNF